MNANKSEMDTEFKVQVAKNVRYSMSEVHYHDFYEILIQDQGEREHLVNNILYCLAPGDIMLLRPYVLHRSISSELHTRSLVYFTEDFLTRHFSPEICEMFFSVFQYNTLRLSAENYYRVSKLVKEMKKEDSNNNKNLFFVKLAELFMILLQEMDRLPTNSPENKELVNTVPTVHSPIIDYVHENYLILTGIQEVADTFYVTPSYLCRFFKKLTGCTLIQYINTLKLQYACELLRKTEKPVTEIALDCGFHSAMYFCKVFKSMMNITPTEYRKM